LNIEALSTKRWERLLLPLMLRIWLLIRLRIVRRICRLVLRRIWLWIWQRVLLPLMLRMLLRVLGLRWCHAHILQDSSLLPGIFQLIGIHVELPAPINTRISFIAQSG
jgi:hypothetical protein